MKGRDVSVRIGGGYAKIEDFIEKKKILDRVKIKKELLRENKTYH